MTRPIAVTEKIALLCLLLAAFGLAFWQWDSIVDWLFSLAEQSSLWTFASSMGWMPILLTASCGSFVLLWGLALFLTAEKD